MLTGSVSRGMADDVSDIEMLVVTREPLELEECFELARAAGLEELGTWGAQGGPARRVSGYREGEPLELIWWPREFAEARLEALFAGEVSSTADALAHGVPLRTSGLLEAWQERLREYPPELAAAQIEEAALPWGGFTPAGVLTIVRPDERPTTKRLSARVAPLAVKPDRLAERIEEALTEPDPRRALLVMTELQLETVVLAPSGPNVDRARTWLAEAAELLR